MDIVYEKKQASAYEVLEAMSDPPGYSAIRTLMRILEKKGHLRHARQGARYIYQPTEPMHNVAKPALSQLVKTFFGGNVESVISTLISDSKTELSEEELDRLAALIEQSRERERRK